MQFDCRWEIFQRVMHFVNYEMIEGDILEFGCYTGRSLALLALAEQSDKEISIHHTPLHRHIIGFDSFTGLAENSHPRWGIGAFRINHSWHPIIGKGEIVTPQVVFDLFAACDLSPPILQIGDFANITLPHDCKKAAVVHLDCDLYKSTLAALDLIAPILQNGTILLFDDWFNFRDDSNEGEQRALQEFLSKHATAHVSPYYTYATFAKAFIYHE